MADLSREDVLKLARLARLELTEDDVERYRSELSNILKYVEKIQSVDVSDLKPTSQVTGLTSVMRDDTVVDYGVSADDLLRIVPIKLDRLIKVKRMIQ